MTRYEKISLGLSVLAVAISIFLPLVLYYFFPPAVREAEIKLGSLLADGVYRSSEEDGALTQSWSVSVENHGKLGLSNVAVMFKAAGLEHVARTDVVAVDPPVQNEIAAKGDTVDVTFRSSLAPTSRVVVTLRLPRNTRDSKQPSSLNDASAWVSSDATPISPVPWRYGGASVSMTFHMKVEPKVKVQKAKPQQRK